MNPEHEKIDQLIAILQGMKEGKKWEILTPSIYTAGWWSPLNQSLDNLCHNLGKKETEGIRLAPFPKLRNKRPDELPYVFELRGNGERKGWPCDTVTVYEQRIQQWIDLQMTYTTDGKTFESFQTTEEGTE